MLMLLNINKLKFNTKSLYLSISKYMFFEAICVPEITGDKEIFYLFIYYFFFSFLLLNLLLTRKAGS